MSAAPPHHCHTRVIAASLLVNGVHGARGVNGADGTGAANGAMGVTSIAFGAPRRSRS
jgi:hypothetical protein